MMLLLLVLGYYWGFTLNSDMGILSLSLPLGIGLSSVMNPIRFMKNMILYRPLGQTWWARPLRSFVTFIPWLGTLFTLGSVVKFSSGFAMISLVAIGYCLMEAGVVSAYNYVTALIPLFPILEPILEALPSVVDGSSAWTQWIIKKFILLVGFIWSHGFSKPLYTLYYFSSTVYMFLYTYLTSMIEYLPQAWSDSATLTVSVFDENNSIIDTSVYSRTGSTRLWGFVYDVYQTHLELGWGLAYMGASQVLAGEELFEYAQRTHSHSGMVVAFGLITAATVLTAATASMGPMMEGIGYLFS